MKDMKTVKVAAAVIKDKDRILIAQRLKGEFKGKWEFPGGKLEENEDAITALKREIKEEMEADIETVKRLLPNRLEDPPSFSIRVYAIR